MTRLVERSYLSILLERDPDYYARTRNTNRVEYKMSNGREFLGHDLYANYFPQFFPVLDEGLFVYDEGVLVVDEFTYAEYLAEIAT